MVGVAGHPAAVEHHERVGVHPFDARPDPGRQLTVEQGGQPTVGEPFHPVLGDAEGRSGGAQLGGPDPSQLRRGSERRALTGGEAEQ